MKRRRMVGAGLGIASVAAAALTFTASPLVARATAVVDSNINPCGDLWSGGSSGETDASLNIIAGNMSDTTTSGSPSTGTITTTLVVSDLQPWAATDEDTANEYYFVFAVGGTDYYTNVESSETGITYNYGTYSSTTGYSGVGSGTGSFNAGEDGTVTVTVPISDVGSPDYGTVIPASSIYGVAGKLTGAEGSGLVSSGTDEAAHYDYQMGETCGSSGGGSTPSPTPTASQSSSGGGSTTCTPMTPEANVSENNFECPVAVTGDTETEPTIIADDGAGNGGTPRLFVTGPAGVPTGAGGEFSSPLFTSNDGGNTWSSPAYDTFCAGAAGGDTDLVVDSNDNIYETDLSLASSCLGVSTTHGTSFSAGSAVGTELQPGDDRPWLGYSDSNGEIWSDYDGLDALHVTSTAPVNTAAGPDAGIQAIQDYPAITESAVSGSAVPNTVRQCVCPPGGIAVDNSSGAADSHTGRVYLSFSDQLGMAVIHADPTCTAGSSGTSICTAPTSDWSNAGAAPTVVPGTDTSGSAFETEWNFAPVKVDSNGVVYVMFARAPDYDSSSEAAGADGVQEYYAYSTDGGNTFSSPILLSTEDGSTGTLGTTTFPTMSIVGLGVVDFAWYGTTPSQGWGGDPNDVPTTAQWNLYYTRVSNAASATPTFTTGPEIAVSDMHNGCIQTGGGKACGDRSLLDFFTIIDDPGSPDIIYAAGGYQSSASGGDQVYFTKLLTSTPANTTPEAPWTGLLMLPGIAVVGGVALLGRRRRRRNDAPLS